MLQTIIEQELRSKQSGAIERANELRSLQPVLPSTHFSKAVAECKSMYVMGYYYGTIMLSQSCAEGLAKYIAERKGLDDKYHIDLPGKSGGSDVKERVDKLLESGAITQSDRDQLLTIHSHDRNALHHMNRGIPLEDAHLKSKALRCLKSLYGISTIGMQVAPGGTILVTDNDLWDSKDGTIDVYLNLSWI